MTTYQSSAWPEGGVVTEEWLSPDGNKMPSGITNTASLDYGYASTITDIRNYIF